MMVAVFLLAGKERIGACTMNKVISVFRGGKERECVAEVSAVMMVLR